MSKRSILKNIKELSTKIDNLLGEKNGNSKFRLKIELMNDYPKLGKNFWIYPVRFYWKNGDLKSAKLISMSPKKLKRKSVKFYTLPKKYSNLVHLSLLEWMINN